MCSNGVQKWFTLKKRLSQPPYLQTQKPGNFLAHFISPSRTPLILSKKEYKKYHQKIMSEIGSDSNESIEELISGFNFRK